MKATVYNQEGGESGEVDLPERVFERPWNPDLVHQVVTAMQANARPRVAHTKDRSEVRGGGRKPWRQKGTGRARHGSIRSPLWAGGGQSFGPRKDKDYSKKINKKMKREALFSALAKKYEEGEVIFLDTLSFDEPKTAAAKEVIEALAGVEGFEDLSTKDSNAAFVALGEDDENTKKSFRNFGNMTVGQLRNLNALDILKNKYIIITEPEKSIAFLSEKSTNTVSA